MPVILLAVLAWSATGAIIATLGRRQGHNFVTLLGIGLAYGPMTIVFLLFPNNQEAREVTTIQSPGPVNSGGWIDVLVGLDGSDECLASTSAVIATLGPAVRRLRLASVLDLEVAARPDIYKTDEQLTTSLEKAAIEMGADDAKIVLHGGRPDEALVEHAVEQNMDLLVVAHRQHRAASVLLGSAVARLARNAKLPIIIGPPSH